MSQVFGPKLPRDKAEDPPARAYARWLLGFAAEFERGRVTVLDDCLAGIPEPAG